MSQTGGTGTRPSAEQLSADRTSGKTHNPKTVPASPVPVPVPPQDDTTSQDAESSETQTHTPWGVQRNPVPTL